jgi:hypothetical protein
VSMTTEDQFQLAATRAKRLADIMAGYEVGDKGAPDSSVPGAARIEYTIGPPPRRHAFPRHHPRYVLVTQYGDHGDYRVYLADDLANVERLAVYAIQTDEDVICYFDLGELAGPEPEIAEGDTVVHPNAERFNLAPYVVERVQSDQDGDPLALGSGQCWSCEILDVIERAEEDERMPVRYGLAKVVISVVFNTIPSPA